MVPPLAPLSCIHCDWPPSIIARVVAAKGSPDRPVGLDRARVERQMRDLALDHVAERIDYAAHLDRLGQLRADLAAMDTTPRDGVSVKRAAEWLRVLAETWATAEVPEAKADLPHAIYERITVVGRTIISVRLTRAAYANGLALALPQVVMARPEGFEHALPTIVIEGVAELVEALRAA
jgi:hypothetical protein